MLAAILVSACVSDPSSSGPPVGPPSARGVYVVNEGGFGQGNASLTYYDPATGRVEEDVFAAVNGRPLGDVANSMVIRGGRGYIVVNNSNTVEVIDVSNHSSVGTINVGTGRSPRQMVFLNDSTAAVTALYDDAVILLNLRTLTTAERIPVGPNPDGIALDGRKAFVANSGLGSGHTVSVIDLDLLAAVRTIDVPTNPYEVHRTGEGLIYVLCAGTFLPPTPASIVVLDPVTERLIDTIALGAQAFRMGMGTGGRAYVPLGDSVLTLNTREHRVEGTLTRGMAFYGVAVDTASHIVYLSDAGNFTQAGSVHLVAESGLPITTFVAGVIPGWFAFKR